MAKRSATTPRSLSEFFDLNPNVSQAQIARLAGISAPFLSELKSGRKQASLATAVRLSDITGVPMRALVLGAHVSA